MNDLYRIIINSAEIIFPPDLAISEESQYFIRKCLQIEEASRFSWLELYENGLMGPHFESVAKKWREAYESAASKLNKLRETAEP